MNDKVKIALCFTALLVTASCIDGFHRLLETYQTSIAEARQQRAAEDYKHLIHLCGAAWPRKGVHYRKCIKGGSHVRQDI